MVRQKLIVIGILTMNLLGLTGCLPQGDSLHLTVKVHGQGQVEAPITQSLPRGTIVDLKALPAQGWTFSHWEGLVTDPASPDTTVLLDRQQTVTAIFVSKEKPQIHVAPGGLLSRRSDGSQVIKRNRGEADIQYIMLHAISDAAANPGNPYEVERVKEIFREYAVEAHYLIDREGRIYQFVEDDCIARHAGVGTWNNEAKLTNAMNRYSIGIELMGIGTRAEMKNVIGPMANTLVNATDRGYTDEQYLALNALLRHLQGLYKIPAENIISHRAYDPGRKWDPGDLFAWEKVHAN